MIKGMAEFMTSVCTLVARVIPLPEHVVCLHNKDKDGMLSYLFPLPIFVIFLSGNKFIGTVLFLLSSSVCSTGQE